MIFYRYGGSRCCQRRVCVSAVVGFHAAQTNARDCSKNYAGQKAYAYLCLYKHWRDRGSTVVWMDEIQALKAIEFGVRNPEIPCKVSWFPGNETNSTWHSPPRHTWSESEFAARGCSRYTHKSGRNHMMFDDSYSGLLHLGIPLVTSSARWLPSCWKLHWHSVFKNHGGTKLMKSLVWENCWTNHHPFLGMFCICCAHRVHPRHWWPIDFVISN